MADLRCGALNLASFIIVFLATHVRTADPNVVLVPDVDGVKLTCPTVVPDGTSVNWKGPSGSQLNFANGTFADSRLSYVDGKDLQIANAVPADNGNYMCIVGTVEVTIVLMVYVTDRPKLDMSFAEEIWDTSRGFYQIRGEINESKTITCMIKGAFPMPTVSLTIMNYNTTLLETIPTGDITVVSNLETDNTYSVNATTTVTLSKRSNNRRFDCNAMFDVDGEKKNATKYARFFLLKVRPTLFVYSGLRTVYATDNSMTLTCIGSRGRPGIDAITFYIEGVAIAEPYNFTQSRVVCTEERVFDEYYTYMTSCESNLTLRGLTKMDNEKDTGCTFMYQNETLGSPTNNRQGIDFRFPPTMVTITGNMLIEVPVTSSKPLTLTCATDSSNGVSTISWYRGGVEINSTEVVTEAPGEYGGKTATQALVLNVDRSMAGETITCHASNIYNFRDPVSASVVLNVTYSPMLIQPTAAIYRVYTNERIQISCYAEAKPMATTKWMKVYSATNKTEVTSIDKKANGNTILDIQNAALAHAGNYECQASNSILPDVTKTIELIVLDKSGAEPFDIKMMTPLPTGVVFEITLPSDRVIQSLYLRYYSVAGLAPRSYVGEIELTLPTSGNQVSVTVAGLMPDTDYVFELRETDASYGLVSNSFLQQVKTLARKEDEYTKKDVTTAILISVFVTAAVVIIICVIIFCLIRRGGCGGSSNKRFDLQMKPRA